MITATALSSPLACPPQPSNVLVMGEDPCGPPGPPGPPGTATGMSAASPPGPPGSGTPGSGTASSQTHAAGCVKIADFGLARIFQSPARPLSDNGVVVTIWYRWASEDVENDCQVDAAAVCGMYVARVQQVAIWCRWVRGRVLHRARRLVARK